MLYTDQSILFAASEIAAYRAIGVDIEQIKTYRQFTQMVRSGELPDVALGIKGKVKTRLHANRASCMQRQPTQKKDTMAKRFGRHAMNGTMEYYDTYEELRAAQQCENARIRTACFGLLGLISGGLFAYVLMQWMQVDSKIVHFIVVIVGIWFGGVLAAALSALMWKILKWTLSLMVITIVGLFIWFTV